MMTIVHINKKGIKEDQEIRELAARLVTKWREEEKIQAQKLKMKMERTSQPSK